MTDLSYRNFTNNTQLRDESPVVGVTIHGSCFSQDKPDTQVFADGSKDIAFFDCNLDNVVIPPGSTIARGCARRWCVQSDGFDWIVDADGNPIERL